MPKKNGDLLGTQPTRTGEIASDENDPGPDGNGGGDKSFSAPWNAGYRNLTQAEWIALGENSA